MNTIFATLLAGLCLQGALASKGLKHERSAAERYTPPPMNGSWIELAGLFEGDIKLNAEQERQLNSTERQGISITRNQWTKNSNGVVTVPYTFRAGDHDDDEKEVILKALAKYASVTCYEFVERKDEPDYIEITNQRGCWSYVGKQGGAQQISLQRNGCVYEGIVIHEFMHAMGFFHEQSRYDRDQYVRVNWNNICCNAARNFGIASADITTLLDQPYDYKSIMHYGETDFSNDRFNGLKTIEALDGTSPLGQRDGLTQIDIAKNLNLYQCTATTPDPEATTEGGDETTTEGGDETTTEGGDETTTEEVDETTTEGETTTQEPTTTEGPSCEDDFPSFCERQATRGQCTNRNNRAFMVIHCAASCEECDTDWCYDSYPICTQLARKGWCSNKYEDWMSLYCPESCGVDCDAVVG